MMPCSLVSLVCLLFEQHDALKTSFVPKILMSKVVTMERQNKHVPGANDLAKDLRICAVLQLLTDGLLLLLQGRVLGRRLQPH